MIKSILTNLVVNQLSLGSFHAAVVTITGDVYTWGNGING